jgi:hypothetical protein
MKTLIEGSSPRHQATAQSQLNFARHFNFDLTYRYVSALPEETVASYFTADSRFAWQFVPRFQLSVVG